MFGDNPSPETPPNGRKGFFMLDKAAVDYLLNRVCGTLKSDISAKLF